MKYFYVYYSYEEYGRGYIGKRECKCLPEEDIRYFGSYTDKSFNPTCKIILQSFDTAEEALIAECKLHNFYNVDINSHFANKSKQTSSKFYYNKGPGEDALRRKSEMMKTEKNPMYNPEIREKARLNLIKSLKDPKVIEKKSKSARVAFSIPEIIEKRRLAAIKAHKNPETKRKHIESKLGPKNPCYGKRWITNGIENKYIDFYDIIPNGFRYGRVVMPKNNLL